MESYYSIRFANSREMWRVTIPFVWLLVEKYREPLFYLFATSREIWTATIRFVSLLVEKYGELLFYSFHY